MNADAGACDREQVRVRGMGFKRRAAQDGGACDSFHSVSARWLSHGRHGLDSVLHLAIRD